MIETTGIGAAFGKTSLESSGTTIGPQPALSDQNALDDLLSDLNRHPLFMTTLDETDGAGGSNAHLDALRALAYEGTKAEVAENFKQQGNDCVKAKRWGDAKEFYGQALDVLAGNIEDMKVEGEKRGDRGRMPSLRERLEGDVGEREVDWLDGAKTASDDDSKVVDLEEEARKEQTLEEACVLNRAKCNLELKNYAQTTRDCAHTLKLNPRNNKAYYRSALALLALNKTDLARRTAAIGLTHLSTSEPAYKDFRSLVERIEERDRALKKADLERAARRHVEHNRDAVLKQALKQRHLVLTISKVGEKLDLEDATMFLDKFEDPSSELHLPILVLYPTSSRSELIKDVGEMSTVEDLIGTVLPAPWDESARFGADDGKAISVFVESGAGGLRKVGSKVTWSKVLVNGGCKIEDGLCKIMVVPKVETEGWIADWKTRNGKG